MLSTVLLSITCIILGITAFFQGMVLWGMTRRIREIKEHQAEQAYHQAEVNTSLRRSVVRFNENLRQLAKKNDDNAGV